MEGLIKVGGLLLVNPQDGSVKRMEHPEHLLSADDPNGSDGVASKDVTLREDLGLWARVYITTSVMTDAEGGARVPVIVYFPGGGFCLYTASLCYFDSFCRSVAKEAGSIVVSVQYRLAPEHRLPSAYDDAASALQWLLSLFQQNEGEETRSPGESWLSRYGGEETRSPGESWLSRYGDMDKVFLMGDSAGGNIVHHVIALGADGAHTWQPRKIRGLILLQPFFGGEELTESERVLGEQEGMRISLKEVDTMWRLSLPQGANKDHRFSNIRIRSDDDVFVKKRFPSALVMVGGKDMLRDRGFRYAEDMKRSGKDVEVIVYEDEEHGFYVMKQDSSPNFPHLLAHISAFVSSCCSSQS